MSKKRGKKKATVVRRDLSGKPARGLEVAVVKPESAVDAAVGRVSATNDRVRGLLMRADSAANRLLGSGLDGASNNEQPARVGTIGALNDSLDITSSLLDGLDGVIARLETL